MTGYELAQWQYDMQEPPELPDIPEIFDAEDEYTDLYDLAARMIACAI